MRKLLPASILLVIFLIAAGGLSAQSTDSAGKTCGAGADTLLVKPEKDCQQKAIGDLFRKKEKAPKPPKKFMALVLPSISSNPSNGFLLGVGGTFGWYMGPRKNTHVSSAPFTVAIT